MREPIGQTATAPALKRCCQILQMQLPCFSCLVSFCKQHVRISTVLKDIAPAAATAAATAAAAADV